MRLTIPHETLLKAMQAVCLTVPRRTLKDIFLSVRLGVSEDGATLFGTNGERSVLCPLKETSDRVAGTVLLPAGRFMQMLKVATGDTVTIEQPSDLKEATIVSGDAKWTMETEDPADFPQPEEFGEVTASILAYELKTLIQRSVIAVECGSTRYSLGGVRIETNGNEFRCVATDSRRLVVASGIQIGTGKVAAVVCGEGMKIVGSLIDGEMPVDISISTDKAVFRCESATITAPLLLGRFPNWTKVMPRTFLATVAITSASLKTVIHQAVVFANDESRGTDFGAAGGVLSLSHKSHAGKSQATTLVQHEGDFSETTFDCRYFTDFIDAIGDVELRFHIGDATETIPSMIEIPGCKYVVMPLGRDK